MDNFSRFTKQCLNHPFLCLWKSGTRVWCSITPRWQDLEHHMNSWLILHSFVIVYINCYANFTLTVALAATLLQRSFWPPNCFLIKPRETPLILLMAELCAHHFGALAPRLSATYLYFGGLSALLSFCCYLSFHMVLSQCHVSANLHYHLWIKIWNYICCAGLASAHS